MRVSTQVLEQVTHDRLTSSEVPSDCAGRPLHLLRASSVHDGGALLLPHESAAVPAARRALVEELRRDEVAADVVSDVAVVVSELLGNAVRHAAPLRTGDVMLTWCVEPAAVEVAVVDGGGGEVAEREAGRWATSGRGLGIVDALSTAWGELTDQVGRRTVWAAVPATAGLRAAS